MCECFEPGSCSSGVVAILRVASLRKILSVASLALETIRSGFRDTTSLLETASTRRSPLEHPYRPVPLPISCTDPRHLSMTSLLPPALRSDLLIPPTRSSNHAAREHPWGNEIKHPFFHASSCTGSDRTRSALGSSNSAAWRAALRDTSKRVLNQREIHFWQRGPLFPPFRTYKLGRTGAREEKMRAQPLLVVLLACCRAASAAESAIKVPVGLRGGSSDSTADAQHETNLVRVSFQVECHSTSADECIAIVGAPPELGKWKNVMIMAPDWPRWKIEVDVPKRNEHVEYKYVKVRRDGVISTWEPGKNRLLKLSDSDAEESISTNDGLFAGENAPAKQKVSHV